ncbi:CACNA1I [Symbiodinium sp. CCMP2592]|nr:CACNA1I [Symbiodinium sp. CCMP2592]
MAAAKLLLDEASAAREMLLRLADEEHERWLESVMERFSAIERSIKDWDAQFTVKHEEVHEKAGLASPMLIVSSVRPTQPPRLAEQVDPVPPSPAMKIACNVTVDESQKSDCDSSPRSPFTGIQDPGALQRMISPSSQTMAARASVMGRPPTEEESCLSRLAMWLRFNLDYCTGFVLAINLIFMCVELELQGRAAGHLASESSLSLLSLQELSVPLRSVDIAFDTVFLIEFLLRMGLEGWALFRKFSGWYDVSLVAVGIADMALFAAAGADAEVAAVHVLRAANTLRAIRLLRIFRLFQGLRLLIRACHAFLPTLGWSMVLLGLCMVMSGLLVGSLLQIFLWNDMLALEHKIWIFDRYGTAHRSIYTLFEITFAGNWPTNVRPVLENVSDLFVIPFVLYITIITFAALRVITAVFLKDTLEAAQSDAEHQVAEKLKRKAQYVEKLEVMFKAIDETGNGMITEERLNQLLCNPTVRAYLETLDLAVPEGTALFHILDNGDGEVTLEEFIDGILRCKGPARAIDQVALHADIRQLDHKLAVAVQLLSDWERSPDRSGTQSIDTSLSRLDSRKNKVAEHLRVFHLDQSMELDVGRMRSARSARSGRSGSSASDARYSIFSVLSGAPATSQPESRKNSQLGH